MKVGFPGGSVDVRPGTILSRALNMDRLRVETPCGGQGRCRKCLVRVVEGEAPPTPADLEMLWPEEIDAGYRLACRLPVESDITVEFDARPETPVRNAPSFAEATPRDAVSSSVSPSVSPKESYGVAIDLGTTTIAAVLARFPDGAHVASGSTPNPQSAFGADVMARLSRAAQSPEDRVRLQAAALEAVASLVRSVASAAGICVDRIATGVLVGNSAMHHLALGFDTSGLAEAPYRPSATHATSIEFPGLPLLYAAPLIGGFAGSDAVAAALSEGLHKSREPRLLVDLGTNTEMLLACNGRVFACSAPAGPAFEGAEISQGMAASVGAVESVRFRDGRFLLGVIGGGEPVGFCGSGVVDAVRAMLDAGLVDAGGRLRTNGGTGAATEVGKTTEARGGNGAGEAPLSVRFAPDVRITQKDVRSLQLAKGAVRAGIEVLLEVAGIGARDIEEVLLAGTFGSFIRPDSAVAIGLLPEIPASRVKTAGNAALRGAKMMLLSETCRDEAETLARSIVHVSLCEVRGFEDLFLRFLDFRAEERA